MMSFNKNSSSGRRSLRQALLVSWFVVASLVPAASSLAQRPQATPERMFAEAYQAYSRQLYEQAAASFASFRLAYPEHLSVAEALYYEAQANLAIGQEAQAVRLFEAFHSRYPAHPLAYQARLALGKYFYDTAQYERAIGLLQSVLDDAPTSEVGAKALYWMAEASLKLNKPDDALAYYVRVADRYPGSATAPQALLAAGFTQISLSRHKDAAATFERLTSEYPSSPFVSRVGLAQAEAYYEVGQYREAISEIESRISGLDAAGQERANFLLAESYSHLRQNQQAISHYRQFTEGDPNGLYHRPALYGLGWNLYNDAKYEQAAREFARLRTGKPDALAEKATYYQAVNQRLGGKPQDAVKTYREYLSTWPTGTMAEQAGYELIATLYELKNWAEAIKAVDDFVKAHPQSQHLAQVLQFQANANIALGKYDAALRSFDRAVTYRTAPDSLVEEILFERAWMLYRSGAYLSSGPAFLELYQHRQNGARGPEALFWAAESAFQSGSYENAERLYKDYLRVFKQGQHAVAAQYALGWIYFKQQNYSAAISSFEQFLVDTQNRPNYDTYRSDAAVRLGDSYLAMRRYEDAVRAYERVTGVNKDYALYQIGQAHLNSGNAQAGIDAFEQLLSDFPRSDWAEEALYNIGYLHFTQNDYNDAVASYRELIARAPRDVLAARAQFAIGDARYNEGRYNESAEAYRQVLDVYPDSPYATEANTRIQEALFMAGGIDMGDPSSARQAATEKLDPQAADEIRFREAVQAYRAGRLDQALDAFSSYVKETKEHNYLPDAYYYQGAILADQGNFQAAVPMLRRVMDAYAGSPRYLDASLRLGQLYVANKRYSEALAVYRALESGADDNDVATLARARYGQSLALIELDRGEEAIDLLQEIIDEARNDPEVVPAMLGLARVYDATEQIEKATEAYRAVVRRSHDQLGAEALYRLGTMLLERGDPGTGVQELSRLPAQFGAYPDWVALGYLAHARALRDLGQNADANRMYERITREFRGTPVAQTATRERSSL